jgi:non-specific serine/threonine protein kinase
MVAAASPAPNTARPAATRSLGRFALRQLLGKSLGTMVWLVDDPRDQQELMLVMPRTQPPDAAALERWYQAVRKATRLNHPHLAAVVEVGEHERWPFVAYARNGLVTLDERLAQEGGEPIKQTDMARWMVQALEGLAFAHEAGMAHHDLQFHSLLVTESGQIRVMGLEIASIDAVQRAMAAAAANQVSMSVDAGTLHVQRAAAARDVLSIGLVLHQLLVGQPALEEPDISRVIDLMPPVGREMVRLPFTVPIPIPDALRAIVNRSTERQERQRYRNARTLARALEGWLDIENNKNTDGPLAMLIDRMRMVGHLPAMPGAGGRIAKLRTMERERTLEMAEFILQDIALTFELLKAVNSAQIQGTQVAGTGPVLTMRRAIAMIGLDGTERAVTALRPWPGPLSEQHAEALRGLMERSKSIGLLAQALRPAGYDPEVVFLVALLQNLGRLLVQYHFPEEAIQIRRLMQPIPPEKEDEKEQPGMTEEAAAMAVIGVDIEAIGAAVARHWGLPDDVLHMIRRLSLAQPVRQADSDGDLIRATCSCANEAFDAIALPAQLVKKALDRVAVRYGRVLNIVPADLQDAIRANWHGSLPDPTQMGDLDSTARPTPVPTSNTTLDQAGSDDA